MRHPFRVSHRAGKMVHILAGCSSLSVIRKGVICFSVKLLSCSNLLSVFFGYQTVIPPDTYSHNVPADTSVI
jgi:hypothetical protein